MTHAIAAYKTALNYFAIYSCGSLTIIPTTTVGILLQCAVSPFFIKGKRNRYKV